MRLGPIGSLASVYPSTEHEAVARLCQSPGPKIVLYHLHEDRWNPHDRQNALNSSQFLHVALLCLQPSKKAHISVRHAQHCGLSPDNSRLLQALGGERP